MTLEPIKLFFKNNACEIAIGVNIASTAGGIGLATYGTIKALDDFAELNDKLEGEEITEKKYKQCVAKVLAKRYAPVIGCATLSIGSVLFIYNKLKLETAAAVAAATAIETMYSTYRSRVVDKYGEDIDFEFANGFRKTGNSDTVIAKNPDDESDQTTVNLETIETIDDPEKNKYMFWWDYKSAPRCYTVDREINTFILKAKEIYWNQEMHRRGDHEPVTLNEVLKSLGLDAVDYGQVVGWTDQHGAGFIDFGLYQDSAKGFMNHEEAGLWLNFNVQGVIIDKYD